MIACHGTHAHADTNARGARAMDESSHEHATNEHCEMWYCCVCVSCRGQGLKVLPRVAGDGGAGDGISRLQLTIAIDETEPPDPRDHVSPQGRERSAVPFQEVILLTIYMNN